MQVCMHISVPDCLVPGHDYVSWGIRELPSLSRMLPRPASWPLVMGAQVFPIELRPPTCFGAETLETGSSGRIDTDISVQTYQNMH